VQQADALHELSYAAHMKRARGDCALPIKKTRFLKSLLTTDVQDRSGHPGPCPMDDETNILTTLLTREEAVETGAEPLSQRHKMRLVHGEEEGANIQRGIGQQREQAGRVDEQLRRQPTDS
jgi:hypothetical protein